MLTLVLLPGMDGTGDLFAPFIEALGGEFAICVVRYPTDTAMDYAALTNLAREALPRCGPFLLLGESFSGPIAVALAAERPSGLVGLILCSSFVRNPRPALGALRGMAKLLSIRKAPSWATRHFLLGMR